MQYEIIFKSDRMFMLYLPSSKFSCCCSYCSAERGSWYPSKGSASGLELAGGVVGLPDHVDQRRWNAAAQRLCTGGGARVGGGGHGWRDETVGVRDPTYGAAEPSACGPRLGRRGDPGGGAARPLRRGKGKKLTSVPRVSEGRGRGSPRLDLGRGNCRPRRGRTSGEAQAREAGPSVEGRMGCGHAWKRREESGPVREEAGPKRKKGASRAGLAVI
jgi:hypothetical protein